MKMYKTYRAANKAFDHCTVYLHVPALGIRWVDSLVSFESRLIDEAAFARKLSGVAQHDLPDFDRVFELLEFHGDWMTGCTMYLGGIRSLTLHADEAAARKAFAALVAQYSADDSRWVRRSNSAIA